MRIVLVAPEIPQNTGSIARLCAATETELDLIEPLGFSLEDRYLRRAGLDYWPSVRLAVHASFGSFLEAVSPRRLLGFSSHGGASYTAIRFRPDDALVFGCESRGLPASLRDALAPLYRIPMRSDAVRSLNLATAAGIVLYEGLRQLGAA